MHWQANQPQSLARSPGFSRRDMRSSATTQLPRRAYSVRPPPKSGTPNHCPGPQVQFVPRPTTSPISLRSSNLRCVLLRFRSRRNSQPQSLVRSPGFSRRDVKRSVNTPLPRRAYSVRPPPKGGTPNQRHSRRFRSLRARPPPGLLCALPISAVFCSGSAAPGMVSAVPGSESRL